MIVLHAIWNNSSPGALHIWAESSDMSTVPPRRAGKQAEAQKPRLHPFALAHNALTEAMEEVVGSLLVDSADSDLLALRLPSRSNAPLSSPELLLEKATNAAQPVEFKWWKVATLVLDAEAALDLLLALPTNPPQGVAFGSSLRFWSTVANFAFELITRQNFAPGLSETREGKAIAYRAAWELVLSEEDMERLQLLARAMPPLCWSFVSEDKQKAALLQSIVLHFLNQAVDGFVRGELSAAALYPPVKQNRQSLPAQWLHALVSDNPVLTGSAQELANFAATLRGWVGQLRPSMLSAPFRTCFRLDSPEEDSAGANGATNWQVSYHLQANDDRSLLVPSEQVWQERSGTLTFLKRKFENPQERLLGDLGKAVRLFPKIEASLRTAHPTQVTLNTEQAYQFLRESAPLLEESGYGVLVPPWWQKRSARVGVKLQVRPKSNGKTNQGFMGLDSLVDYNWNIAIGDTTLTPQEFEKLVNLKQPLVQVRGQWVELRPEEIEAAIAFFQKKQARKEMSLGEALRIGVGHEKAEMGLPVLDMEAEGWIKDALDKLSQRVQLSTIKTPATFQGKLRPYQEKGLSWLAFLQQFRFGACLADDMGLGKTAEMIALLLHNRGTRQQASPSGQTLIICPMSIVGNWHREIQRFAPSLSVMVHHGLERLSGAAFEEEARKHDVVITTYSLALRDKEHLASIVWDNVVVDEAQNIKNESAKQTQAIKSLQAGYRIALTGTPVENRLSELWSIMEFLNPGYLGSGAEFRKSFALPIERYHNAERAETLKQLIQPFVLRRVKTDKAIIKDLPDKMEMKVFCNLTQEQASLYEAVVREMIEKIEQAEGIERKGLVLATLMRLKQVCNHPAQFMGDSSSLPRRSGKLSRLEEMLEEVLAAGDKALIFTQFAEMGSLLRQYLQETLGCETLFLHGGTSKKQRDAMVQHFQEERKGVPLFILSLKAGGVGLNLTAANHVFHFDRWWNPAVENQATDRAFRIGQTKNVQVHKFVCVGTLEERIDQMIEQKKELAESIVGSGENWV
ncbi:MAG TPA: DEAD/DEAH box helicase, partial [Ktedonobacteraceae bacterium]|nr:DEAD/DEAH box helicase [Ktedonobacteraceae bacterium]